MQTENPQQTLLNYPHLHKYSILGSGKIEY